MSKLLVVMLLLAVSALGAKNCIDKSPFPHQELTNLDHSKRVSSTLEAVFNRRDFNFSVIEGHSCRNASETSYWYHVVLVDDNIRSEVTYVESARGSKRGRVDYLVLEEGQSHYVYRWKAAPIK
ncbi:uncharacterized protein LOC129779576 [Toxorhynchites rutilus septentrionalis]|uniref:uncharacterized protein LOC129779576 n=1 Tax=Toxorhynchites rutilus septentrionalis TaxID=329112 RepID=UPI00247982E4|nr:uncharacterized protein LOC129779576 [Toxorhynchites rutilus septentrionalis]